MVWAGFFTSLAASAQLATNVTVTNLQGQVFSNITLDHTNASGVIWVSSNGDLGQLKYSDLAMEYWERFNLSNSASEFIQAARLRKEQEQQELAAREEVAREQAKADAKFNQSLKAELSASNSDEQTVDKMTPCPTNMTPDEIAARDGVLKALLDISSATYVGVNREGYGSLLAKANSALEFGKTKLSPERHEKFLICGEKALLFYAKANDEWSDYFKYDWERDQEETIMTAADFHNLKMNGVMVDTSNYRRADDSNNSSVETVSFFVPFKESLSLYWQAADIYVQKMKSDSQR